jgi:hypothetical protein
VRGDGSEGKWNERWLVWTPRRLAGGRGLQMVPSRDEAENFVDMGLLHPCPTTGLIGIGLQAMRHFPHVKGGAEKGTQGKA